MQFCEEKNMKVSIIFFLLSDSSHLNIYSHTGSSNIYLKRRHEKKKTLRNIALTRSKTLIFMDIFEECRLYNNEPLLLVVLKRYKISKGFIEESWIYFEKKALRYEYN